MQSATGDRSPLIEPSRAPPLSVSGEALPSARYPEIASLWRDVSPGLAADASALEDIGGVPNSRGFRALLWAYRATGGAARGEALVGLLQARRRGDLASLTRHIVSGEIFSFEWRHTFWVPMFQFEPGDLSIKHGPRKVLAELVTVFDSWSLAAWFAQPNSWLKRQRPVDLLDSNLPAVFAAARADRFAANG